MKKELIGLDRYLYTFTDYNKYLETKNKLKDKGQITEIFINNGYGFEIKMYSKIM